jgi:hypothetical protein
VKKLVFAVGFMAVIASTAWAQNDGSSKGPNGYWPQYYYSANTYDAQPPGTGQAFDPTAHYWDYYRLDPGHGIDVDRTTPP